MNARHTYPISTLVACLLVAFGTSASLAERRDQSKHSGQAPSHAGQVRANPNRANPNRANPVHVNPVHVNPVHVNPVHVNPVHVNPVHVNPVHVNPGHANPGHANPGHANPSRANPGHVNPGHAGQVHATHSAHGNLARSSVHSIRPGYQVHRAEATYRHSYPVHRYPSGVVVARPVFVYPPVVYDATCIRIVNPAEVGVTVSYTLDGQQILLQPGEIQTLYRRCVITFDRGNGYGLTQLVLAGGTYTFGVDSDGGWSLFRN